MPVGKFFSQILCTLWVLTVSAAGPELHFLDKQQRPLPNYQAGTTTIHISGLTPRTNYWLTATAGKMLSLPITSDAGGQVRLERELAELDALLLPLIAKTKAGQPLRLQLLANTKPIAQFFNLATLALKRPEPDGKILTLDYVLDAPYAAVYDATSFTSNSEEEDSEDDSEVAAPEVIGAINAGRLVYPAGLSPEKKSKLVLLVHGNGFDHVSYSHLQQHLAAAGYAVASVASPDNATIVARHNDILHHLAFLLANYGDRLTDDLILIGHSRGGEAVIHAANSLLQQPMGNMRVRTIISLAPSYEESLVTPATDAAGSLLILYGTHDEDVTNDVGIGMQPFSPFRLYDQTWTTAVTPKTRAMVLIHGADHMAFSDKTNPEPMLSAGLAPATQQWACRTYIDYWLKWQLDGESACAAYFNSNWLLYPEGRTEPLAVSVQCDATDKLVIDDFEDLVPKKNTLGGALNPSRELFLTQGPAYELEAFSPHDSGVAMIGWRRPASLWFDIPASAGDFTGYSRLSFRVAQVYKDEWNQPAGEQDFQIALCTRTGTCRIRLSDIQHLPYPVVVRDQSPDGWDYTVSAMKTIQIPLAAFGDYDLSRVTGIGFIFQKNREKALVPGLILLDDLALQR